MTSDTDTLCSGCGQPRKLVKSHIIPESFCKELIRGTKPPVIVAPNEFVKISQRGIYDQTILCDECEQKFSIPDDYAQKLLIQGEHLFQSLMNGSELVGQTLPAYDYQLLQRFVLSVLWRASVSSHHFFKTVELGAYQEKIKPIVLGQQPCPANQYQFVVGRLVHHTKGNAILTPLRERIDQTTYWRVYVGDWHFWIKLDGGRQTPTIFRELEAKAGTPLTVLCRELYGSPEYKSAKSTAALRRTGRA